MGRTTWVLTISDPAGDDKGPGTYTYPSDGAFKKGVFDLKSFQVGYDKYSWVFRVEMNGPVENPWGAQNGLSLQLVDIYINTGTGAATMMRNGRNTSVAGGWDVALSLAGWNYGFFTASDPETVSKAVPVSIVTDPGNNRITAKIPLTAIPGDPTAWKFAVAVMSNDGYGINGARDVTTAGGQWAVGGAPADKNHPRIIDLLRPAGLTPTQEELLSAYTPSQSDPTSLGPNDFPQIQMVP
jgi:carbohydrate-binding DOMON domain-containing protein